MCNQKFNILNQSYKASANIYERVHTSELRRAETFGEQNVSAPCSVRISAHGILLVCTYNCKIAFNFIKKKPKLFYSNKYSRYFMLWAMKILLSTSFFMRSDLRQSAWYLFQRSGCPDHFVSSHCAQCNQAPTSLSPAGCFRHVCRLTRPFDESHSFFLWHAVFTQMWVFIWTFLTTFADRNPEGKKIMRKRLLFSSLRGNILRRKF